MTLWSKSRYYMLLDGGKNDTDVRYNPTQTVKPNRALLAGIMISLVLNMMFIIAWQRTFRKIHEGSQTAYAHLGYDVGIAWESKSQYFGEDEIIADRLWEDISVDNGTVALEDGYVEEMGLPAAQRFPWDQDKGLYLLNGFHSMHCLKTIRQAVLQFDQGIERSEPTEHILHCLDALRQDILCYADDTPRYTGLQSSGRSGTGQVRQCKDWSQLEAWAQSHTACWRYTNPHDPNFDSLRRHQFCPDGSPYIAKVKEVFGHL